MTIHESPTPLGSGRKALSFLEKFQLNLPKPRLSLSFLQTARTKKEAREYYIKASGFPITTRRINNYLKNFPAVAREMHREMQLCAKIMAERAKVQELNRLKEIEEFGRPQPIRVIGECELRIVVWQDPRVQLFRLIREKNERRQRAKRLRKAKQQRK